ncbi:hypothetical protein E1262_08985 [Jiangella aurantiaca]|uniref:Uncharacterized protein n=1 Tax=Jiangella aurantiaca TaxID=2530373 RepID=A0A4R5AHI1_9ACTN|nr:hypothetical protein [Jiangella aurantiaca]TDD70769.1 hypothetical protein E1262_08985 [Jiangella aurantiaca]
MRDLVAELDQALGGLPAADRRAALRALMPSVVRWYQQSLDLDDRGRPADIDVLLWVEELSAGLIGPLCAAAQDVRRAATPPRQARPARRMPSQRFPRAGAGWSGP